MLEYDRIGVSEGNTLKECNICQCWCFKHIAFKYEPHLCNGCHDLIQKAIGFADLLLFLLREGIIEVIFGI